MPVCFHPQLYVMQCQSWRLRLKSYIRSVLLAFLRIPSLHPNDICSVPMSRTVFSRTFSIVLRPSRDIPACSRPLFHAFLAIPHRSVSFRCHLNCPVTRPFRVSRLIPSLSSFLLVFLHISILGSDRSESGSLCSNPFTFLFSHNSVFR